MMAGSVLAVVAICALCLRHINVAPPQPIGVAMEDSCELAEGAPRPKKAAKGRGKSKTKYDSVSRQEQQEDEEDSELITSGIGANGDGVYANQIRAFLSVQCSSETLAKGLD